MPGKGSPRVTFRCPDELLAWLESRVEWSKAERKAGEHTLSSLIVELIEEGRAKRKRSAAHRKPPKKPKQLRASHDAATTGS